MKRTKGFTLVELLVVMAIIALLLGLLLPALANARRTARQVKDATQVNQIHKSFLTWATDNNGEFPTPGLMNRLPYEGVQRQGRGAQDYSKNSHDNLYSALIAQNFVSPQVCVSPSESSSNVAVASDFNYNKLDPASDSYWDDRFDADLEGRCNVSYATLKINGARQKQQWRSSIDAAFAVVGNRGVKNGVETGDDYKKSKTLEIHGSRNSWEGNIAYNDGHVVFEKTFIPQGGRKLTNMSGNLVDDNLFFEETFANESDMFLIMCKSVTGSGTQFTHNPTWD